MAVRQLEQFLRELSAYPLLNERLEVDAARQAERGSTAAIDFLCRCNARVAVALAHAYRQPGRDLSPDVLDEGMYGLVRTAHRFKLRYGVRFIHLAVLGVQFAILDRMPELASLRGAAMPIGLQLIDAAEPVTATRPTRESRYFLTEIDRLVSHLVLPVERTVEATLDALDANQAEVIRLCLGLGPEGTRTPAEIAAAWGCGEAEIRDLSGGALASLRSLPSPSS